MTDTASTVYPPRVSSLPQFPRVSARNLEGLDAELPGAFTGRRNVVLVAFRRDHQRLVDSWLPWFESEAADDPDLRFYEVPTIARIWAPARRFIDGGMAAAIKVPAVLQRTFTVYGDVSRVTGPLGLRDTSTVAVVFVDGEGRVRWKGRGGLSAESAAGLHDALEAHRTL